MTNNYNEFKNGTLKLVNEIDYLSDANLLLDFLVKFYVELAKIDFNTNSLEELFHIIKNSLWEKNSLEILDINTYNLWNIFSARSNFRDFFQKKEFNCVNWSNLLKVLLFLQIAELIAEIENWRNFDKWENLSIKKYIEAWISGLIDLFSWEECIITPLLVCAFIEFGKNYE